MVPRGTGTRGEKIASLRRVLFSTKTISNKFQLTIKRDEDKKILRDPPPPHIFLMKVIIVMNELPRDMNGLGKPYELF